jgi:predicted ATPase
MARSPVAFRKQSRLHGNGYCNTELREAFPALGYETIVLPKIGVATRADFILRGLHEWT